MKNLKPFKKRINIFSPLLPELKDITKELKDTWSTGFVTNNGPKAKELELKLKKFIDVPNITLVTNGTTALIVSLKALDLKGEIITTPFTFAATTFSASWNNLKPVFCDIDYDSMNIDTQKIESLITPKTSAILATHVYGMPCDVEKIKKIADKYSLKVIYDGAHSFNTKIHGKSLSRYGDITIHSFHATKLFSTVEGGGICCKDFKLKERLEMVKNFGNTGIKYEAVGLNGRMSDLHAAVGLLNLRSYSNEVQTREKIFSIYTKNLKKLDGIKVFELPKDVFNSFQYYPIRIIEERFGCSREKIFKTLDKFNVQSRKYFDPLCSDFECYKNLKSAKNLSVAKKVSQEVLCLPLHSKVLPEYAKKICLIIQSLKR